MALLNWITNISTVLDGIAEANTDIKMQNVFTDISLKGLDGDKDRITIDIDIGRLKSIGSYKYVLYILLTIFHSIGEIDDHLKNNGKFVKDDVPEGLSYEKDIMKYIGMDIPNSLLSDERSDAIAEELDLLINELA